MAVLSQFRHPQRQAEEPYDAGSGSRQHGFRSPAAEEPDAISKGPATRCSAATRCSPAIASAATSAGIRRWANCCGCEVIPLELVDQPLLPSRHVFLPVGAGRGDLLSAGLRRLWPRRARAYVADLIARQRRGEPAFRLQCGGAGPDGDHQHRLPRAARAASPTRLRAGGMSVERVRQGRRQRQVPDAPARRRRRRRLAAHS